MNSAGRVLGAAAVALLLAALPPPRAAAEPLAMERFDYVAPSALAGKAGGVGWGGPWACLNGSARVVTTEHLVRGVHVPAGEAELAGNTRAVRPLTVAPDGVFDRAGLVEHDRIGRAGGVLYVGFRQRTSRVPGNRTSDAAYLRYYAFELLLGPGGRVLEIGHDDRTSPPWYGAASVINNRRDDQEPGQFQPLGEENTGPNFLVVKITFGPGDRDRVEVFRDPESREDESASTVDATLEGDFTFDRIGLARFVGNEPVHSVGEIRLGTAWADVFPPVDEEQIQAALARAEKSFVRQTATCRAEIDRLAAKGVQTAPWQEELARIEAAAKIGSPRQRLAALGKLRQSIQIAGLDLGVEKLLFVKRHMFQPTHIYTEFSDGPYRPGGGLFVLSPVRPDGEVTRLFDAAGGIVRDPEVSFDGRRVLFSYREQEDGHYHIWEMDADGTDLRQLTDGPYHDLDPFCLPDGRIGFTSTRCKSRALCFWVRAATLFVMEADGSEPQPLTANNVNEFTPQVLDDGRVLYTRWEYLDKSAIFVQSLWAIRPDGTRATQLFGNNLIHPVSLLQTRPVPRTRKFACVLGAHNGDSVGPLAVIDPSGGLNDVRGILDLVPECDYHTGCFAPYPLDDRWCLVSFGPQEPFGIYAFGIDPPPESVSPPKAEVPLQAPQHPRNVGQYFRAAVGPRHLIYRDATYSCVEAMPLAPRSVPPRVAPSIEPEEQPAEEPPAEEATLVLVDVYRGLGDAVPRGAIKHLRIVEEMGHRDESGRRDYEGAFNLAEFQRTRTPNFMDLYASPWEGGKPAPSLQAKSVRGTVPVEPDGSAHFRVPARRPVYFQALDEDYNEIQRMRSYVHLEPGERQSCVGCHEHRQTAPPAGREDLPLALRRGPSRIEPPPFGAGPFSYVELVQPILDRRCVSCHGGDRTDGGLDLSARRDGRGVPASFASLVRPRTDPPRAPLVDFFDNWWGVSSTVPVASPGTFGTAASRLIEVIDNGHEGVEMSPEERAALRLSPAERRVVTTWIDLNCPLWDNYSPQCRVAGP